MASHREYGLLGGNIKKLIHTLVDEDEEQRYLAAIRLGELGNLRAVEPLIVTLTDPTDHVRAAAAEALGELGDRRALDPLVQALSDPQPLVSKYAALALGLLGDERAIQPLLVHLGWVDHYARRNPSGVLILLLQGHHIFEPLLTILLQDKDYSRRAEAANVLGGLQARWAVESLLQAIVDPNRFVQLAAVRALGQIGDKQAVEPLLQALSHRQLRRAIIEALGDLQDSRAVEPLLEIVSQERAFADEETDNQADYLSWLYECRAAFEALGKIGDQRAVEALIRVLSYQDESLQNNAAAALDMLGFYAETHQE